MAEKILKEVQIRNAQVESGERLLGDGGGLFLRVRASGERSWVFIAQVAGKRHKHGLGAYPEISLAVARERAREAREHAAGGVDPSTAKKAAQARRRDEAAAILGRATVRELFDDWHARELSRRKDQGAEVRRLFEKDVLPTIGSFPAESVRRRQIVEVLDVVKGRGARRQANVLLQNLRQLFRFGALREVVEGDPTFGLNKLNVGGRETVRDRFLSEREIGELAEKLELSGISDASRAAIWLMLATATRIGEVCKARWSDVNEVENTWTIPAETAKNGREHRVHLSPFAEEQLSIIRGSGKGSLWWFPNRTGKGHLCPKALQKQFYDRQRDKPLDGRSKTSGSLVLSGGQWRAHDLRRTAATLMGELRVRSDVIERCLNHVGDDKLVMTYQRQQLMAERIEAFRVLGERLDFLSRGAENTVAMKAA